ncbi:S-layer homology domain-containing protein [Heliophilum fasciatum]|uniref:S-layer family protein n=1 Tax=Heliophilum fasciatum TaxID=35700 RepID=A0A4R2R936_9FIRM|nr:S-layer homology domain-containing protein [Heliophilum fasciatum]MCW2279497.1 hypothetical protein [Heliophilum fasciatum]TCP58734.1 S-layer family protein [Heliophilum fasciatum]
MGKINKEVAKGMILGATLATMITSGIGIAVASTLFTDVPNGQWYSGAVNWAKQEGIMQGVGNDQFAPDAYMTRAQFAQAMKNLHDQGYLNKQSVANPATDSETPNNTTPAAPAEGTTETTPTAPAEGTTETTPTAPAEGTTETTPAAPAE